MTAKTKPKKLQKVNGRPTAFRPEYVQQAAVLCLNGATDAELAYEFDVSVNTIGNWKAKYPKFLGAIRANKGIADDRVERSLYSRAVGHSYDAVKVFGPTKDRDAEIVPYVEHAPPDVTAQIFWLKNRRGSEWRDHHDFRHTGSTITKTEEELRAEILAEMEELGLFTNAENLLDGPKGVSNRGNGHDRE